jgi:hypothetical protein
MTASLKSPCSRGTIEVADWGNKKSFTSVETIFRNDRPAYPNFFDHNENLIVAREPFWSDLTFPR